MQITCGDIWSAEFTVIDCLHSCFSIDEVDVSAVSDQKAGVAYLVDQARSAVCGIQDRFYSVSLKDWLETIGTPESFLYVGMPFFFCHPLHVVVHDNPLAQRLMDAKPQRGCMICR